MNHETISFMLSNSFLSFLPYNSHGMIGTSADSTSYE